ncbi:YphA family membrane protein [Neobacillus sp. LXY-1]|uniref:YphA family membrane protein n=1 Tax=Neobacillus sp. LXY-1 TaxID=3379133 RepID=UPI003EE23FE2
MEGTLFYLIFWMLWVYVTFILSKQNPYRFKLAAIVLVIIIFSDRYLTIGNDKIYLGGLFLLLFTYLFLSFEKKGAMLYLFICSLIVSIAYITFLLFEIFDPIWLIFKREWMMGAVIGYLALLLHKDLKGRLLMIACGTMQGEFLYAYFISNYQFPYSIGDLSYLDVFSLISGILVGWKMLESTITTLQHHFHFLEKERKL